MKKKTNPTRIALFIILTILNILIPVCIFFYALDYSITHTVREALGMGLWLFPYFPFAFALGFINLKAILYYKSVLSPHGIARVLFFVILFALSISMIYYVIGFITVMFYYASAIPALMALF